MTWNDRIPLIAILRGITPQDVVAHIESLIAAGFGAIEIPLNSPNYDESIALAVQHFGDKAWIGAGTVVRAAQIDRLAGLGCKLIVTPNTNTDVIKKALALNMIVCSGCATATEAFDAIDAGAENLKVFPSATFGPAYIAALKTILPKHINVFAVGGVTPENLHLYLQSGCIGAGLGNVLYQAGQSVGQTAQQAEKFIKDYHERA